MNPVSLFLTKNSLIKVALTEVLIVSSHVTDDNIDVEFASDGQSIRVHPKFVHQEIPDLTFPNKQALDSAISSQTVDTNRVQTNLKT